MAPSEPPEPSRQTPAAARTGGGNEPAAPSLRAAVARITCDGGVRGTAFLIDPQHALTALHVVADRRARPPLLYSGVQLDFSGHLTAATVVDGAYDADADFALLRLHSPPRDAAGNPVVPLPLDDLGEDELQLAEQSGRALQFHSRGFPDANPDDGLDIGGQVRTTLGQVSGVRALQLFSSEAAAGTGAPVSGLSGAPVFCAGAVVGLLRTAILDGENRSMAGALFACPAATVLRALAQAGTPPLQLARLACPYPGMVAFARHQSSLFFGRTAEIDWLLLHLRKQRFALVLGPSGSGKSSLVHAGLLPHLPPELTVRTLRPGDQPERELDAQLGGAGQPLLAAQTGEKRLLLFIDQMEELFARCPRPVQQQFLGRLQALRSDPRCILLLALRADFFPDLMSSMLWPIDPAQRLEVAPLRGAALAAAIAGPAAQVGVRLEPTLLERLVADAAEEPGALPLLQEALVLLWERRENRRLTLAAYEQLGRQPLGGALPKAGNPARSGLAVAIASHAEAVFAMLAQAPVQQALARRIFLRLVHFGEGRPNTRRQLPRSALRAQGDDAKVFDATLELLASQRLLTQSSDDASAEPASPDAVRVDLSHEVMLRAWPRLLRWIDEKKQAERVRRRLEDQATERVRLRLKGYGLLDDAETQEAEHWLQGPDAKDVGVSTAVAELIHDSRRAIRRAARGWQIAAVLLLIVAASAAGAAGLALQESRRAGHQFDLATAARQQALAQARIATARTLSALSRERLGLDTVYDQALLLAVAGQRLLPSADAESSLLAALERSPGLRTQLHGLSGKLSGVAVSPDGQLVAAGSSDGQVQLFDARRGQPSGPPFPGHTGAVNQLGFTSDSARLITAGTDGVLRVFDASAGPARGQPIGRPLSGHTGEITALAISPDGKLIASGGGDDMTILLWDAVTGLAVGPPLHGHKKTVSGLAFSADGKMLASVSWDQTVRLWAPRSGQPLPLALPRSDYPLRAVAFSPTAPLLAVGGGELAKDSHPADGAEPPAGVQLWSLEQPAPAPRPLHGLRRSIISSLAFSPSGQQLAAGSWDKLVFLWSVGSGRLASRLHSPLGPVLGLAYAPSGEWLATATESGGPLLWSTRTTAVLQVASQSATDKLTCVAVSPDGKSLAAGSYDHALHRFTIANSGDSSELRETAPLVGPPGIVYAVAYSPSGQHLASAGEEKVVRRWTADGRAEGEPLRGHSSLIYSLAFDPTDTRLASGSFDGELRLWSAADGKPQGEPLRGHSQAILGISFSPDGSRLCSASQDISLRVWDARTGAALAQGEKGHSLALTSCAFTRDSSQVVTASEDGTLRIWTLSAAAGSPLTLKPVGGPLRGHRGKVQKLIVTPDGQRVLSVGEDQTLRLWDLPTQSLIGTVGTASGSITGVALVPHSRYAVTVGEDRAVRLWDLDPSAWLRKACQRAGRDLTPHEKTLFLSGLEEQKDLGQAPLGPLCPPEP